MSVEKTVKCFTALLAATTIASLAACGGGGDSTASTNGPTATTQSPSMSPSSGDTGVTSTDATGTKTEESPSRHPKSEAAERAAYEKARYGSPSPQSAPFAKYSGKGKAKLHLAEFGSEASSGKRAAAQAALEAYLQATGEEEWGTACAYLSAEVKAQIEQLAPAQATGGGCGEALEAAIETSGAGAADSPSYASDGIDSLRIEEGGRAGEGTGFALFHGSDGRDHWMAMKIEGRDWKIISTIPQPFR